MSTRVADHLASQKDAILERMLTLIRFPSVSTDPAFADGMRGAREFLLDRLRAIGMPDVRLLGGPTKSIGWVVPVDDTHFRLFHAMRVPNDWKGRVSTRAPWSQMTEQEHQDFPGDWEAQVGQGPISFHSEENLTTSDKGVVMLRRLLRRQIQIVKEGGDPIGVTFDPAKAVNKVDAGNFYRR